MRREKVREIYEKIFSQSGKSTGNMRENIFSSGKAFLSREIISHRKLIYYAMESHDEKYFPIEKDAMRKYFSYFSRISRLRKYFVQK